MPADDIVEVLERRQPRVLQARRMTRPLGFLALLALIVTACRSTPSAESSSVPAQKASSSPTTERCLATMYAEQPPSGWIETGSLIVSLKGGHFVAVEARDTSGRVIASGPLATESDIESAPCKAGGTIAVSKGEPPQDGTDMLRVFRPAVESEPADLALLCKDPGEQSPLARSFPAAAGLDFFVQRLTTPRWRRWLLDVDDASKESKTLELKARELETAAVSAGLEPCWGALALTQWANKHE